MYVCMYILHTHAYCHYINTCTRLPNPCVGRNAKLYIHTYIHTCIYVMYIYMYNVYMCVYIYIYIYYTHMHTATILIPAHACQIPALGGTQSYGFRKPET